MRRGVLLGLVAVALFVLAGFRLRGAVQSPVGGAQPTSNIQPCPTTHADLAAIVSAAGSAPAGAQPDRLSLYIPDGQLVSHAVQVYVNRDIPSSVGPRLHLFGSNAVTEPAPTDSAVWVPRLVAPGQEWRQPPEDEEGQEITVKGTLLLFDLKPMRFNGKAMRRFRPVLCWTEGTLTRIVIGKRDVNVGSIVFAGAWTAGIVGFALLAVIGLAWRRDSNPMLLLTGVDGHLSLAQTQIACWTVAVGSVVLLYGLVRIRIPDIPESLLVLMGASLATGGVAFFRDAQKQTTAQAGAPAPATSAQWHWGDLVRSFEPGKDPQPSLAKAQMLVWTVILILLFVSKSILDGAIWNVPWALVALLGFSQAGYLAPKLAQPQ